MIYTIDGRIGSGKSYYVVDFVILPALLSGRDVFVNFEMKKDSLISYFIPFLKKKPNLKLGKIYFFNDFNQLKYVRSGVIVIDEAQDYIDAQKFYNLPSWFKVSLSQNRKKIEIDKSGKVFGTDIYAITQDFYRIDINFRRYSYNLLRVRNSGFGFGFVVRYDYSENAKTQDEKFRKLGFNLFKFKKEVFSCYNSFEMIKSIADISEYQEMDYKDVFNGYIELN